MPVTRRVRNRRRPAALLRSTLITVCMAKPETWPAYGGGTARAGVIRSVYRRGLNATRAAWHEEASAAAASSVARRYLSRLMAVLIVTASDGVISSSFGGGSDNRCCAGLRGDSGSRRRWHSMARWAA